MKKHAFKPGFEFIFSLCICTVLGLPPLVFAQTNKDMQITINNGDTTINGKKIKDLSVSDRQDALKNINQIATINSEDKDSSGMRHPMAANGDRHIKILKSTHGKDTTVMLNYSMGNMPKHKMEKREMRITRDDDSHMGFGRRNTQNFIYNNIDNDGISTHVSYRVSDHPAMLDYDAGKQGDSQMEILELTDLNLIPELSQGKTVLMFNLLSKAPADVQFKDGKGATLWTAKAANGTFTKTFPLGLNGLYYLQVKQGGKVAVKKIEKE